MTQEGCIFSSICNCKDSPLKTSIRISMSPCRSVVLCLPLCLSAVEARGEEIWDVFRRDTVEDFVLYRDLSSWIKVLRKRWDRCAVLLTEGSRRGLKRDGCRVHIIINLRPKYKNPARQNIHYTFLKLKIVLFFSRRRLRQSHTYTLSHTQTQARLSSLTTVKNPCFPSWQILGLAV